MAVSQGISLNDSYFEKCTDLTLREDATNDKILSIIPFPSQFEVRWSVCPIQIYLFIDLNIGLGL